MTGHQTGADNSPKMQRTDLAEDRTDWAEDRTLLANERTFAGWMRTGLAAAGLGLGFHAVFKALEPLWLGKTVASIFVAAALVIFIYSYRKAHTVRTRMNCHSVEPVGSLALLGITSILVSATFALGIVVWIL